MNNTLALIKPDAMQKGFKDDIREDIMNNGFIIAEEKTLHLSVCLLYTSPSPRDLSTSRMPSSA